MSDLMKVEKSGFSLEASNFEQALKMSEILAKSDMVPKNFKDKPGDVLVAIAMGHELGLKPLQALQNIAAINGRPTLWGDAMLAVVQAHPDYEYHKEWSDEGNYYCIVKRVGVDEVQGHFSIDKAKKANLLGKQGPWTQYPERMLQMRARGFALRDSFADALKGIQMREEVQDYQNEEKPSAKVEEIKSKLFIAPMAKAPTFINEINFDRAAENADATITITVPPVYAFDVLNEKLKNCSTPEELQTVANEIKSFQGEEVDLMTLRRTYKEKAFDLSPKDVASDHLNKAREILKAQTAQV